MTYSYDKFKSNLIMSKEYVYGVSIFLDHFRPSFDQVGTPYHYLYIIYYTFSQSVGFLTYLLEFYSGRAVDLWSC